MGVIKGGTAHNITAKDCHFEMDIRVVSDQKVDFWIEKYNEKVKEIETEMKAISEDAKIVVSNRSAVPALQIYLRQLFLHLLRWLSFQFLSLLLFRYIFQSKNQLFGPRQLLCPFQNDNLLRLYYVQFLLL